MSTDKKNAQETASNIEELQDKDLNNVQGGLLGLEQDQVVLANQTKKTGIKMTDSKDDAVDQVSGLDLGSSRIK